MTSVAASTSRGPRQASRSRGSWGIAVAVVVGVGVIVALGLAGLSLGTPALTPAEALRLLMDPTDTSPEAVIVRTIRLPRALLGIAAGAALAVAGVLMQALTRNPLADPGLLGVNAGAAFAVALAFVVFDLRAFSATLGFALVGAASASAVVWVLGGAGRSSMSRLVVAGVAVGAVLAGVTQALGLLDPSDYALIRTWEAGSLTARDAPTAFIVTAVVVAAVLASSLLGPGLNLLALGDDQAHALGGRVVRIRGFGALAIVVLAGTATAAIGPIGFVGLLVPHALRAVFGGNQVRLLWLSMLGGPVLLLGSDLIARTIIAPDELPIAVVTAILGAPLLIALVQRGRRTA